MTGSNQPVEIFVPFSNCTFSQKCIDEAKWCVNYQTVLKLLIGSGIEFSQVSILLLTKTSCVKKKIHLHFLSLTIFPLFYRKTTRFWWQDSDVKVTPLVTFLEFVLRWSRWPTSPCWHCTKARRRDPGHKQFRQKMK